MVLFMFALLPTTTADIGDVMQDDESERDEIVDDESDDDDDDEAVSMIVEV
jgi:hypothetical protein